MARYVKLDDIQSFPIRIDHCDHKNGNIHFMLGIETVMEFIEKYHKADSFLEAHGWKWERQAEQHDCRDCYQWLMCPNGMRGHINGTSIGFSSGECKDFRPLT